MNDKTAKWPTLSNALRYGAPCGGAYALYKVPFHYWYTSADTMGYAVGSLIGGLFGGALLVAIICGARNLFVR